MSQVWVYHNLRHHTWKARVYQVTPYNNPTFREEEICSTFPITGCTAIHPGGTVVRAHLIHCLINAREKNRLPIIFHLVNPVPTLLFPLSHGILSSSSFISSPFVLFHMFPFSRTYVRFFFPLSVRLRILCGIPISLYHPWRIRISMLDSSLARSSVVRVSIWL